MMFNRAKLNSKLDELIISGCTSIFAVNLQDGMMEPYLFHSEVAKSMADEITARPDYDYNIANFIQEFVISREQEEMRMAFSRARLNYKLSEDNEYTYYFHRFNLQQEIERLEFAAHKVEGLAENQVLISFRVTGVDAVSIKYQPEDELPTLEHSKRTILILEDKETMRTALNRLLGHEYHVLFSSTGEEAIRILRDNAATFSLALIDVDVASKDAYDFLQEVSNDKVLSMIPVIATASESDSQNEERKCLSAGALDFIQKPYNPDISIIRIQNMIKRRESTVALSTLEHDTLTGLYTKEAFFHHVKKLLKSNPNKVYDFVVCDIDSFGLVNQQYGMDMGDRVLEKMGHNFQTIRLEDCIASRIRDDIFAVFTRHGDDWSENVLKRVEDHVMEGVPIKNLQLKFGVYTNVDHKQVPSVLYERAFAALDTIREQFGTAYAYYDVKLIEQQARVKRMELAFEDALNNDEFELWVQPKYCTDSEVIRGAEALIRWRDQDGKLISPNTFIHVFEKDGLIRKLDEYIFRKVCKLQRKLLDDGVVIVPISVNLSCASLYKSDVAERYEKIVQECGVDPSFMPIEITESMALSSGSVKEFTEELYKKGFSFHMDDFGSGYSSLASLHSLRFDVIKMDKTLIDYIGTPSGNSLLKHTIAFAKECGFKAVAEGVETAEQREYLLKVGCDYIQGYYYSAPMPVDMYSKLLADNAEILFEYEEDRKFSMLEKRQLVGIISNNMLDADVLNDIMGAVAICSSEQGNIYLSAANQGFFDLFQVSEETVQNNSHRNLPDFVYYEDRNRFKQMFRDAEKKPERGAVLECRLLHGDNLIWVRLHCYFLRKTDGRKEYYTYIIDRTAAHLNNEILSGVPGGFLIYRADEDAKIVFSNSYLWNIFGFDNQKEFLEYVNYSFKGIVAPDEYEQVQASIDKQLEVNNKKLDYVEYNILHKDGHKVMVSDFGHLIKNEDDEELFYVFISENRL